MGEKVYELSGRDSPLLLLFAGGINDRGEITGEACVIANGACTIDQPAFLAIPDEPSAQMLPQKTPTTKPQVSPCQRASTSR